MTGSRPVRMAFVGGGKIAKKHSRRMLQQPELGQVVAICDPSHAAYSDTAQLFIDAGVQPPAYVPDAETVIAQYRDQLDVVLVGTPHVYHLSQAVAFLEAGFDVLLEKPMVLNAAEARKLIEVRDRTGKLLVVAFDGGLSPQIRTACTMLRSGELGSVVAIQAAVWEDWAEKYAPHWKQQPAISGGGFLFDTGAHMLNTVADLTGEDFVEVTAWLDNRGRPVEILGAIMARTRSGAMVQLLSVGETMPSCASDIKVFCTDAILHTEAWGRGLSVQRRGDQPAVPVAVPPSIGPWEEFLAVREGRIPNPCPAEVGLRMARFYEAICESAAKNGVPVRLDS